MKVTNLFNDLLGFFPEPPDTVVLRVLGLTEKPSHHDEIKQAFRERVKETHPDINAVADSWIMDELTWARDALLRKVPAPVTNDGVSRVNVSSRNGVSRCKACDSERLNSRGEPFRIIRRHRNRWVGYCWPCARDAENERQREIRKLKRTNLVCGSCGELFTPKRADSDYCSNRCRQRAYRNRVKENATASVQRTKEKAVA